MTPTWPAWLHQNAWDDAMEMTGHGLDDVDDVPEPNRRPPRPAKTSPTPQTGHATPARDTTTHTGLDT